MQIQGYHQAKFCSRTQFGLKFLADVPPHLLKEKFEQCKTQLQGVRINMQAINLIKNNAIN